MLNKFKWLSFFVGLLCLLVAKVTFAGDLIIDSARVFQGDCQVHEVGISNIQHKCKSEFVLLTADDQQAIFSFEMPNNKKYSFFSKAKAVKTQEIEINLLDIDSSENIVDGICTVFPDFINPEIISCDARWNDSHVEFQISSLVEF